MRLIVELILQQLLIFSSEFSLEELKSSNTLGMKLVTLQWYILPFLHTSVLDLIEDWQDSTFSVLIAIHKLQTPSSPKVCLSTVTNGIPIVGILALYCRIAFTQALIYSSTIHWSPSTFSRGKICGLTGEWKYQGTTN